MKTTSIASAGLARFAILAAFAMGAHSPSLSQNGLFDLLPADGFADLEISADFDSIFANIRNKEYVQGQMTVEGSDKSVKQFPLKIRPRGKSRRMMCDFPPLKLKFGRAGMETHGLAPFNDYKLVTHCKDDNDLMEAVLLKEYLTYKLYNLLTPFSFQARLVRITYRNKGGMAFRKMRHWALLIEDAESLASRNHAAVLDGGFIAIDSLHITHEKIASLFQYMIGNADWSYLMARNVEFVRLEDGMLAPVPYDFDYAGLVAAPYARADASLGQKTVLERVYLGHANSQEELYSLFSLFRSKREALLGTLDDFTKLDKETRSEMKAYLMGFFELIENDERVRTEMLPSKRRF